MELYFLVSRKSVHEAVIPPRKAVVPLENFAFSRAFQNWAQPIPIEPSCIKPSNRSNRVKPTSGVDGTGY